MGGGGHPPPGGEGPRSCFVFELRERTIIARVAKTAITNPARMEHPRFPDEPERAEESEDSNRRGGDSIYLARNGFRVEGMDISRVGVVKAARRAARLGLRIRFHVGDVRTHRLTRPVDVVFCSGALNNLPRRIRAARLAHFKANTVPGGINAMNAFVPKPYLAPSPEMDPSESPFRSGELLGYYWDWRILDSGQLEFDCKSSGVPHRHAMDVVIAQKPD